MNADNQWYIDHPISGDALLSLMDAATVQRVVLVQAMSCYGYDNRYVIECARRYRKRSRAVGIVRPGDEAALSVAADELARGELAGVRVFAAGNMTLDDPRQLPTIELARRVRAPVLIMTLPREIGHLSRLLEEYSDVDFVLDHCGFIEITSAGSWPDLSILEPLIKCPNLYLKVSSIVLLRAQAVGDPAQFVRVLADRAGTSRLMWGSDFPHTYGDGYASLVDLGQQATSALTTDEARDFLSGTATKLWPG